MSGKKLTTWAVVLLVLVSFATCTFHSAVGGPSVEYLKAYSVKENSESDARNYLANDKIIKFEPGDMLDVRVLSSSEMFEVVEGNRIRVKQAIYLWNSPEGVRVSRDGVNYDDPSLQGFPRASVAFAPKKKLNLFFVWFDPWRVERPEDGNAADTGSDSK